MNDLQFQKKNWNDLMEAFEKALPLPSHEREDFLKANYPLKISEEVRELLIGADWEDGFLEDPIIDLTTSSISHLMNRDIPSIEIGDVIGDYHIQKKIGEGGSGQVYLAWQKSLKRQVALKVTLQESEEAKTMAHLDHPHIVKVFSETKVHYKNQNLRLINMQWIQGKDLQEKMDHWLKRSVVEVVTLIHQIAQALSYAHSKGILHLDVKPSNILVDSSGRAYLSDFNISTDDRSGERKVKGGTPQYMSPEQEHAVNFSDVSFEIDERTDIYALGCLLRNLTFKSIKEGSHLQQVIGKCTDFERNQRFATVDELINELERYLEIRALNESVQDSPRIVRFIERNPIRSLLIVLFVPQILGSTFNISYNVFQLIDRLMPLQIPVFENLVWLYNVIVYPIGFAAVVTLLVPFVRFFREYSISQQRLSQLVAPPKKLRKKLLSLKKQIILITTFCWLPCTLFFPLGLQWYTGPLSFEVWVHFFLSFTLSWLMALSYSFLGFSYIIYRVLYPVLIGVDEKLGNVGQNELNFSISQWLFYGAGAIPLISAIVLLVGVSESSQIKLVLIFLNSVGILGLILSTKIQSVLTQLMGFYRQKSGSFKAPTQAK